MDLQSDKDIVLIVGASSGLGLACFDIFLEKGYQVVGISRRAMQTNGRGISMQVDVRKDADIKALHAAFLSRGRWPRIIVYCTGQGNFGPVKNYAETNWDNIFQTNVRGAFAVMGCFTPQMPEGGRVVLVGSTAARRPFKSGSVYVGSKAALHAYAAALREELRPRKISVTLCIPGTMATNFFGQPPQNAGDLLPARYVAGLIAMAAEAPPQAEISEIVVQPLVENC